MGGCAAGAHAGEWVDGRLGWASGWVSDVVIRVVGNEQRHIGGVFFGWASFVCIGPQLSLPHSFFVDLLVLLVRLLFDQRALKDMR